ncbi:MAG: sigma-54 dependent transcriptional regulator, partial [Gammaproteobacteria bacterium]
NKPFLFEDFANLNIIGQSKPFIDVLKRVRKVAAYDIAVSIFGETGTGKELIARAIHYFSPRSKYPFIPVNCGSLPDTLFENEMFGHESGAFTDARTSQAGLIAQAERGTLFLDEIEALPLSAQTTLLRFLQDKQYRILGGDSMKTADVHIVAASNENLPHLCDQHLFRQDLYFRLNVMPVTLPPLRAREGDIPLLVDYFIRRLRICYGQPARKLHPSAMERITQYDWPGNIRELENVIHRAFLLTDDDTIRIKHLQISDEQTFDAYNETDTMCDVPFNEAKALAVADFEKHYLEELMSLSEGNISQAATHAGKERRSLGKLLKKNSINPQDFK